MDKCGGLYGVFPQTTQKSIMTVKIWSRLIADTQQGSAPLVLPTRLNVVFESRVYSNVGETKIDLAHQSIKVSVLDDQSAKAGKS